jgi:hypothetical protein
MTRESWQEPDPALVTGGVLEQPGGVIDQPAEEPATVIDRIGSQLLRLPGVEGVGVTRGPTGDDAIVVYVRDPSVASSIAPEIGGLSTIVEVTGPIDAQALP